MTCCQRAAGPKPRSRAATRSRSSRRGKEGEMSRHEPLHMSSPRTPPLKHCLLRDCSAARRRTVRPTRLLQKPRDPGRLPALQPLVASRRADAKATAQMPNVSPFYRRQHHKLQSRVHPGHLAERHPTASLIRCRKCPRCLRTPVHHLSGLNTRKGEGRGHSRSVSDFRKLGLTPEANQLPLRFVLFRKEGRWPSSRTLERVRWTFRRCQVLYACGRTALKRTAKSCGPDAPTLASSWR